MKELKEAVRQAIKQGNWYAALATALTLPDICGWLEDPNPNKAVGERYKRWYNTYIKEDYSGFYDNSNKEVSILTGEDCYALRCAYLHSGQDDISKQKVPLDKFQFITPSKLGESSECYALKTTKFVDDGKGEKYIKKASKYSQQEMEHRKAYIKSRQENISELMRKY
ncbi:hypothetical protein H6F32_13175 [Anabaena sp. FACHB-1237]|uniref:hypothetical protein n=1 Tax=Anabaena sp. FACHB-1237 TaxID=2692769 RepID=UPI0016808C6D|nr:hypothetical protein [Anabaena sp. FACHB-1237]MBD2138520.1 hypothetical protein [Anabaena sp. FACHB-1237]